MEDHCGPAGVPIGAISADSAQDRVHYRYDLRQTGSVYPNKIQLIKSVKNFCQMDFSVSEK